ncbi:MAG: uL15m family ribosomal protein [bacterium]|nr:uL15m family ribosomal protein [bacterium]
MRLDTLPRQKGWMRAAKRVGRGKGSGKGKTSGRGMKGQKARGKIAPLFGGGGGRRSRLLKRLPFLRGIGNPTVKGRRVTIRVGVLNRFDSKTKVTAGVLVKARLISRAVIKHGQVRIVVGGTIDHPITVAIPGTKQAMKVVKDAGGAWV